MAQITYSDDFDAKLLREEGGQILLELTPKAGREMQYSRVILTANAKSFLAEKLEYYEGDKHVKTETRWDYKPVDGVLIQAHTKMVDERTKHETQIEVVKLEVNVKLSPRLFTKRGLIRGKL